MVFSVPENVKRVWETWNLRGLVMVSLSLQVFLIFFASLRKRRGGWIAKFIWLAYLLADWVAAVAIGLISSSQGSDCDKSPQTKDILAFWAPFLLLHLGGPDTITSFALEDNELWVRHLLGLVLQVLSTIYVFLQSLPKNNFWVPTAFVFISGIIKYAERTRALCLASLDHFGDSACRMPNAGPEYQRIQDIFTWIDEANLPVQTISVRAADSAAEHFKNVNYIDTQDTAQELDPRARLRFAFDFFDTFKGLVAGLLISPQDRHVSREVFLNRSAQDVLEIIMIELSLLYEVLHTKVLVLRCKAGFFFRFVNFFSLLGALVSFWILNEHGFHKIDVKLTYSLLIGALVLDFASFMYMICSDWTVFTRESWGVFKDPVNWVIERKRWSGSISQYDFMTYCLCGCPKWVNTLAKFLRLKSFLDVINAFFHRYSVKLEEEEWKFIFEELRKKSWTAKTVEDGKRICLQRGEGIMSKQDDLEWRIDESESEHTEWRFIYNELMKKADQANTVEKKREWNIIFNQLGKKYREEKTDKGIPSKQGTEYDLKWSIEEFEYTESLLLWHIATHLCLQEESKKKTKEGKNTKADNQVPDNEKHKAICKLLSDYMFYLLSVQPNMMSTVSGNWKLVFGDTCAETKRFLRKSSISKVDIAWEEILKVDAAMKPRALKGGISKSVLFDARHLAGKLKKDGGYPWELMSQVWVELLCYAAINCRANVHAAQPSNGGELLTFVWLLMNHLGLGTQFSEENKVRLKFKVDK